MANHHTLRVRFVASNEASRQKGLMFAEPLADDEVVLFAFPHNDRFAFWNKNVSFGLTLAFLDENGRALEFADLDAHSEKPVAPSSEVRFVVEAKQGSLDRLGISKGDIFQYENGNLRISSGVENEIRTAARRRAR